MFIGNSNIVSPTIKGTDEWLEISFNFLDVTVSLIEGVLETDLYVKPTDSHQGKLPSAILFIVKKVIRYSHTLKLNGILLNNVRQKELYWYHKLKTYAVFGISEHEDSRR